ncbi:MAG: hypothetical protein FJ004_10545 [Chloroflexi bacterium]|nr:hypothetical protein [Chloroflexota bacterium]
MAKKEMTKSEVNKLLSDVPDDRRFWSCDGQQLKNMSELETYLKAVSHDTFHYHVNESKNDFGNWVRDVMGDEKLSQALQKSKTQAQAARCVNERISELKVHIKTKKPLIKFTKSDTQHSFSIFN